MKHNVEAALPWALIGAASLGMFACTSSGTTRAPFLIDMARDLSVSMPLVANLISLTATAWGVSSAVAGWLSDVVGRRSVLVLSLFGLAVTLVGQALAGLLFLGRRLGHASAAASAAPSPPRPMPSSPAACPTASAAVRWAG